MGAGYHGADVRLFEFENSSS